MGFDSAQIPKPALQKPKMLSVVMVACIAIAHFQSSALAYSSSWNTLPRDSCLTVTITSFRSLCKYLKRKTSPDPDPDLDAEADSDADPV